MLALDYDSLLLCDLVFPAADVRSSPVCVVRFNASYEASHSSRIRDLFIFRGWLGGKGSGLWVPGRFTSRFLMREELSESERHHW
ncbi:hypothetical protein VNO80_33120 [Phaseolus coccineus]|uniref:Uncharacterized protein n=1 Tax=Phaseolus coccineus TaxID=3886 RepID=A0AAN9Q678_PHACN